MSKVRMFAGIAAIAALTGSQAASADDYLYQGDCIRARKEQKFSTIDKLMKYSRYKGVQILHLGSTEIKTGCTVENIVIYNLTERSRTTAKVVYDLRRNDISASSGKQNCGHLVRLDTDVTGTAEFTTNIEQNGQICSVYVVARFSERDAKIPSWSGQPWGRVSFSDGGFTMSQPLPVSNKHWTPFAFTGVI